MLAYELVVGRPPFEVKDEAKTAAAIMYKNDISLPARYSALWADFVKQVLYLLGYNSHPAPAWHSTISLLPLIAR